MDVNNLPEIFHKCEECGVQAGISILGVATVARWVGIDIIGMWVSWKVERVKLTKARVELAAAKEAGHV